MKRKPKISVRKSVEIYEEMRASRRLGYEDDEFFKVTDLLEDLCGSDEGNWRLKTFRTDPAGDYSRKVGVVEFDGKVILSVDERFLKTARTGCGFCNFTLAHELGHVALGHHARNAVVKNFQLFDGPNGKSNIPPTDEELEANYAAVFLQCGDALFDESLSPVHLAQLAHSDVGYVRKAQTLVRLPQFKEILSESKQKRTRVVL